MSTYPWHAQATRWLERVTSWAHERGWDTSTSAHLTPLLNHIEGATTDDADVARYCDPSPSDLTDLNELLQDDQRMHFVKVLAIETHHVYPELVDGFVRGAVYCANPSANKAWIEIAMGLDTGGCGDA